MFISEDQVIVVDALDDYHIAEDELSATLLDSNNKKHDQMDINLTQISDIEKADDIP